MSKTPPFNKVSAFDALGGIMAGQPQPASFSGTVKMITACQDFLQKLHDDAFKAGFEAGCDASEKTEDLKQ